MWKAKRAVSRSAIAVVSLALASCRGDKALVKSNPGEPASTCRGDGPKVATGRDPRIHDFEELVDPGPRRDWLLTDGEVSGAIVGFDHDGSHEVYLTNGHGGTSQQAIELRGDANEWLQLYYISGSCADVSAYSGISFWARTPGKTRFKALALFIDFDSLPAAHVTEGTCPAEHCPSPQVEISISDEWKLFELPWRDFVDPDDPNWMSDMRMEAFSLAFEPLSPEPAFIVVKIDDLAFLPKGSAAADASER
jgi:hypothetical protein